MKKNISSALRCNRNAIAPFQLNLFIVLVLFMTAFASCKKEAVAEAAETKPAAALAKTFNLNMYPNLPSQLAWELQQARAATAKYQNLKNALKDGYEDINVISENMGYHYMKPALVDGNFEVTKPEILVYNKDENDNFHLVAVEYAVPINLAMPSGFTGSHDVWNGTSPFPLWLLHAWVWEYNPLGVFNPTNPNVHLH